MHSLLPLNLHSDFHRLSRLQAQTLPSAAAMPSHKAMAQSVQYRPHFTVSDFMTSLAVRPDQVALLSGINASVWDVDISGYL